MRETEIEVETGRVSAGYPQGFTFDSVHLPRADVKAGTEAATAAAQPRVLPGEKGEDVR